MEAKNKADEFLAKHNGLTTLILLGIVVVPIAYLFLFGERTPEAKQRQADLEQSSREDVWIEKGKNAVLAKLKDPSSAKFKDVYFNKGTDAIPVTCGQINSKNSYGGYGGFQYFISSGSAETTYLQEQVQDFQEIWQRLCSK